MVRGCSGRAGCETGNSKAHVLCMASPGFRAPSLAAPPPTLCFFPLPCAPHFSRSRSHFLLIFAVFWGPRYAHWLVRPVLYPSTGRSCTQLQSCRDDDSCSLHALSFLLFPLVYTLLLSLWGCFSFLLPCFRAGLGFSLFPVLFFLSYWSSRSRFSGSREL